jgi:hypothetical protein
MEHKESELLVYSPVVNARINYIFQLILGELVGIDYHLVTDNLLFNSFQGAKLNYSASQIEDSIQIVPAGLLDEKGINSHQLRFIHYTDHKVPFPVYHKNADFPFDLFSAAFFMVTRYEEYLPYIQDNYGRFSALSSIAVQNDFLHIPVVNRWADDLGRLLKTKFPQVELRDKEYTFLPTIDIDAAWAYKNKGLIRTIGGCFKSLLTGDFSDFRRRLKVLSGLANDPFDTFELLKELHQNLDVKPFYFILFAGYGLNDKNIPTNNAAFQVLVKSLADYARIGIHPSYASNSNPELLEEEIGNLSAVLHMDIRASRQHFLKISMPATYRNLIENDITDDYTMGFAARPGFRAGICSTFKWFDLESEVVTNLKIHPFAIMDGTLRDYMLVDASEAMNHIQPLIDEVKNANGTFISLWHNESLSDENRWKGWVDVYKELIYSASDNNK